MKIALASDHAGYQLKQGLVDYLTNKGVEVIDLGVETDTTRADYPEVAKTLGQAVVSGQAERGILVCGSGVGASVAANKMKGIYAAICHDAYSASQGVQHDKMNVLCLGGKIVGISLAEQLADAFIGAEFNTEAERYQRRFEMVQAMENE